jgi:hypothetical protein
MVDCNGVTTTLTGRLIVSGKKSVRGIGTGDPSQPVAPNRPDSATIEITRAEFEGFQVTKSDHDAVLTMISGAISGRFTPQLALDDVDGVCKVPTRNVAIGDVVYEGAKLHVETDAHSFDVDVPTSNLNAVHGKIGDRENALWGEIVVWDEREEIPAGGDDDGLDPDYDPEKFVASWSCTEHLAQPVSFECGDVVGERLAQGTSRLSIRDFGGVLELANGDTTCGFDS